MTAALSPPFQQPDLQFGKRRGQNENEDPTRIVFPDCLGSAGFNIQYQIVSLLQKDVHRLFRCPVKLSIILHPFDKLSREIRSRNASSEMK